MRWKRIALRDVGDWYGGGTPSKSRSEFWTNGSIPWLSPKDMGPEALNSTQDRVTSAAVAGSPIRLVPADSVAVVVRSGILERMLPVAIVPFETTLNQDMKAVVSREGIEPRWIAWGLRAFERELLDQTRKRGTTVASIEMPRFHAFELPVPDLAEQRRIVDILEDHLSRLDAAARYVHQAARRRRLLFESAVLALFQQAHGRETTLGQIAKWGSGGTPSARTEKYYSGGDIPWVNSGDLSDGPVIDAPKKITQLGLAESSAKWVPVGSILVAMYGATIGKTGLTCAPVTTNQAIAFATPVDDVSAIWLQWYLRGQAPLLRRAGKGGAQPNISQAVLRAWPISVPPMDVQTAQARAATDLEAELRKLDAAVEAAERRAAMLRRSLLAAAFTGQLTGDAAPLSELEELIGA